jgi:PAS domain S-box-containing protein
MSETNATLETQLFYDAFEASPIGIAVETLEGQPLFANPALCSMLGLSKSEICSKHCAEFSPPEDAEKDQILFQQLRAGSIDHYQLEKRFYRRDGSLFWGRLSISLLNDHLSPLVVAMVEDISETKRAQEATRESEERFRLVADTAPVMIWMSGPDKKGTYFNQLWLDFSGLSETDLKDGLSAIVHPEDYPLCHETYCRGFDQRQSFRKECRLRRHDGEYRWMLDIGVPRFHPDGSFAGYIGSCVDVTEQKLAEQMRSTLTRKLVEAQEQERSRIGRELHDDISQRLALLAMELDQLEKGPSKLSVQLQKLQKQLTDISIDVQALSHDLDTSKLEYLGVAAGMKSWCKEFGERHQMKIDFKSDGADVLPLDIGRPLFRVLQEALNNAGKYSGVKRVEVQLRRESGGIHLIVSDSGRGFDVEEAVKGKGLGLTSMQERVRLMNGTLAIDSKPACGTRIHVNVKIESDPDRKGSPVT